MNPLSRIESLIADIIERPAWLLSSRRLHPLEITTELVKAMEARAIRLVDRILAPDAYEVQLHPTDLAAFADAEPMLERELADYLARTVADRDLNCNRPPSVHLVSNQTVQPGHVEVVARFSAGQPPSSRSGATRRPVTDIRRVDSPSAANTGAPALFLLAPDGATVRSVTLGAEPITMGRRNDCELCLPDVSVSREHARIELRPEGYTVADLHSLNGTYVNGQPVDGRRLLRSGDELAVGRYRLRFSADGT